MMINLKKYKSILEEKKLFSPGPIPMKQNITIDFSHRSKEFHYLYKKTKQKLRKKLKIGKEWNILFVQGSGTSAIETVLSSLKDVKVNIYSVGTFGERARSIYKYYRTYRNTYNANYYVLFETSKSMYCKFKSGDDKYSNLDIIDMVSALGYYNIPKHADIVISSSSKILGGLPVMGIILYKSRVLKFLNGRGDYLNINKLIEYDRKNQTPHTSLIPQIYSLYKSLDNLISKRQIDNNCKALKPMKGKTKYIGLEICPVITLTTPNLKKVMKELIKNNIEVYFNPAYMKDYFQISMFNYKNTLYYELIRDILEEYG